MKAKDTVMVRRALFYKFNEKGAHMEDILTIRLSLDGDVWCALVGENIMAGVAGFGDTPLDAIRSLCDELVSTPYNLNSITLG